MVHFQEVPTSYKSANHNEKIDEEGANVIQEVDEEKQEVVVMSKPDTEVRYQHWGQCFVNDVLNLLVLQELSRLKLIPLAGTC